MTKSSLPYLLISSLLAAPIFIWTAAGLWVGFQHIEVPYLLEQYTLFISMIVFEVFPGPFSIIFLSPVLFLAYLIPIYIIVRALLTCWSQFGSDNIAREDEKKTERATPQSHPRSSQ
jgi:hypothetical protein